MTEEIQQLFTETRIAFDKSAIKKFAKDSNLNWHYSISSTRLNTNSNVIVGFNWGAENNYDYEPQTQIPNENFKELYDKRLLGSLQRIYKPLKEYLSYEDIDNCVQTNFCFFRSKDEKQISSLDMELSIPLFHKLIDIVRPKRIIGFSKRLQDYFLKNKLCSSVEILSVSSNKQTFVVAKGIYLINEQKIPIFFLPHPSAQFTSAARQTAWEFCFQKRITLNVKNQ